MPAPTARRLSVACALTLGALGLTSLSALPAVAKSAPEVRIESLFPSDDLTVRDSAQLTGRRVALPTSGCGPVVLCGLVERLNQLDGFDLDPRLAVDFAGDVDPAAVAAATTVEQVGGGRHRHSTGVDRVVYDPAADTFYAHPAEQLKPGTTYRLRVRGKGLDHEQTKFTTMSATDGLLDLRRQIAGRDAGGLTVVHTAPAAGTTVRYLQDLGQETLRPVEAGSGIQAGTLVFGSFSAPNWLRPDRTIEQRATKGPGPAPLGVTTLPFLLVLPPGPAPAGGWPLAIFGHGFGSTAQSVLAAAATNSQSGIATIATHVAGHGYGPRSAWEVTTGTAAPVVVPAYGRGVDVDGAAGIGSTDGSSSAPGSAAQAVGSSDALRQTAADLMTLMRAAGSPTDGVDLRPSGVTYFGQSFGGIYGAMFAGAEPDLARAALNVPGGPITEVARIATVFRPLITQGLSFAGLLNGGAAGFTESLPLRGEAPVTRPAAGSLAIQDYLADTTWLTRKGSPETFAPLIEDHEVLFQVARGDQTVPNPTSYTLIDAGDLFGRTSLYRNDLTPAARTNPHAFLTSLAPTSALLPAALQGQRQIATFLLTGQTIDPDGAGAVWEVPIKEPSLLLSKGF